MKKACLSLFLSIVLCLMLIPCAAFASQTPISVSLPIQMMTSGTGLSSDIYTIRIKAEGDAPLPGGASYIDVAITGSGSITSPEITFSKVGTYKYIARQIPGSNVNCAYDSTVYGVTITIMNSTDGTTFEPSVSVTKNGTKKDKINFVNMAVGSTDGSGGDSSQDQNDSADGNTNRNNGWPKTGESNEIILWITLGMVGIVGIIVTVVLGKRRKKR